MATHGQLLLTVAFTTVCWLAVALFGPETDRRTLIEFYKKVRPPAPVGIRSARRPPLGNAMANRPATTFPWRLLGWVAGCTVIWSSLFTLGNFLYGRMDYAAILFGVFVISGLALIGVVKKLWARTDPCSRPPDFLGSNQERGPTPRPRRCSVLEWTTGGGF